MQNQTSSISGSSTPIIMIGNLHRVPCQRLNDQRFQHLVRNVEIHGRGMYYSVQWGTCHGRGILYWVRVVGCHDAQNHRRDPGYGFVHAG